MSDCYYIFTGHLVPLTDHYDELQILETILPNRPEFEKPEGDNVEEVGLSDYEPGAGGAQDSDDEDDPRGQRIGKCLCMPV